MKKLISLILVLSMIASFAMVASAEAAYTQAPYWEGKELPPVSDRLPAEPMVEDADYLTVGVYGGELKTSTSSSSWTTGKIIEEGLFRFTTEGVAVPNVAKGYDVTRMLPFTPSTFAKA